MLTCARSSSTLGCDWGLVFVPDMEDLATEDIVRAMRSGLQGKLLDMTDKKEGRRVDVSRVNYSA